MVEEGSFATLTRSLIAKAQADHAALRVGWPTVCDTAHRWPVLLDRAEAEQTFDRIAIVDREGETCFENHGQGARDNRRCQAEPVAVERLNALVSQLAGQPTR